jgi:dCMP deaminase
MIEPLRPDVASWDKYFIDMARFVATKSKDRSTKVGCVIVGPDREIVSTGFNGFPRGIDDNVEERHERPAKYLWTEHSERNCIYNAARIGVSTRACSMYMESPPCADCARAIIQAGITTVVVSTNNPFANKPDWKESIDFAIKMLEEAGVMIRWTDY